LKKIIINVVLKIENVSYFRINSHCKKIGYFETEIESKGL